MTLVRTSILNGIAVSVRLLTALGLNKVLAIYIGPSGYAVVGHFSNLITIALSSSGAAFNAGITKYTAEHYDNDQKIQNFWSAAVKCVLASAFITSLTIALFSETLAIHILEDIHYKKVFIWLAIGLPFMAVNSMLLAIMNGKKELHLYVIQNITASLIGVIVSTVLALRFGLLGALTAMAVNQASIVLVTLFLCRNASWLKLSLFTGSTTKTEYILLLKFFLMAITAAIAGPMSQVFVRSHLIEAFGQAATGEWQAVYKISELYLLFFTTTLSVYYLPRIAEIKDRKQLIQEIKTVYAIVLPVAISFALVIFLLRDTLSTLLFSESFVGMTKMFKWQLIGDVLKIGSWILSFIMVGRAMTKWFILTEIIFGGTWVILSVQFTQALGVEGATLAFAANYALYWMFMIWLIRREVIQGKWR